MNLNWSHLFPAVENSITTCCLTRVDIELENVSILLSASQNTLDEFNNLKSAHAYRERILLSHATECTSSDNFVHAFLI